MAEHHGVDGDNRVPTWRDAVLLTSEQKAQLTPQQLEQYLAGSVVRDLSDIDFLPEPTRTWARAAVASAQARVQARIAQQGRSRAS